MGQSCSFAQQDSHNFYRQLNASYDIRNFKKKILKQSISSQLKKIKQICLLQNNNQILYEIQDQESTVHKLPINNWNEDQIQYVEIQEFLGDQISFICKIKYYFQSYPVWKVIRTFRTKDLKQETIKNFALFYYQHQKIKSLQVISKSFIFAQNCSLQRNMSNLKKNPSYSFIIESQLSICPFVPLRSLGFFMRFNKICWQDHQFYQIIKNCYQLTQKPKYFGVFISQQWLIDTKGQLFPIGTLVSHLDKEDYFMYVKQLVVYFCETLYGQKFTINSLEQLKSILQEKQQTLKFKHKKSVHALISLFEKGKFVSYQQSNLIKVEEQPQSLSNLFHYVNSYKAKKRPNLSSVQLGLCYIDLNEFQKAKQILQEKFCTLVYDQIGDPKKINQNIKLRYKNFDNKCLRRLCHKNTKKHQILKYLYSVLENLINLERTLSQNYISPQLQSLLSEYLHLSLIFSSQERGKGNYKKSLSILQETKQFIHEVQFWQLEFHIAACYLHMGDLKNFQPGIKNSLKIDKNQANLCFLIAFYNSVLNWEQSLQLIQLNQQIIQEDFIYDLMMAKTFLTKSLTLNKKSAQETKINLLYQTIKIAQSLIDRKNMPQIILCEAYEIIGDGYFYLKHFATAREFYEKGIVLCSSLEYSKRLEQNRRDFYEPHFMRTPSLQYTQSRSFMHSNSPTIRRNIFQQQNDAGDGNKAYQNSIYKSRELKNSNFNHISSIKSEEYETPILNDQTSFTYQLNFLFDFNKKAILLTSIANCYLMEQNFTQALRFYQQAQSKVLNHNKDLTNSIIGSKTVCQVQIAKYQKNYNAQLLNQSKLKLQKIINSKKQENPSKIQTDVNYLFLLNELNSI